MNRLAYLFLVAIAIPVSAEEPRAAVAMAEQQVAARVALPQQEGVIEVNGEEAAVALRDVTRDVRYAALQRIAADRGLRPEQLRAKAVLLPEGDRAAFVPVVNSKGEERGFLASGGGEWTLSLEIEQTNGPLVETYRATIGDSGRAIVEAVARPDVETESAEPSGPRIAPNAVITYPTKTCSYVSSYSINFGCFNPRSNPFGYYYVTTTRYGYTPDPRSPSWWACYRGSTHVCPRFETRGKITMPRCGLPPEHPWG